MSTTEFKRQQVALGVGGAALAALGWGMGQLPVSEAAVEGPLPGLATLHVVLSVPVIGAGIVLVLAALAWAAWTSVPSVRLRLELGTDGWARPRELRAGLGAGGLRRNYRSQVRPDRPKGRIRPEEVGTPMGRIVTGSRLVTGRMAYIPRSYGTLLIGPPGSRKSTLLMNNIVDTPAGVAQLISTTKDEFAANTARLRARYGQVWVFNPTREGDVPSTFGWNPVIGCEDTQTAKKRAAAMVRGGAAASENTEFWQQKGEEFVRCYLMAAALGGLGIGAIHEWVTNPHDPTPMEILRQYPQYAPASWISTVESYLAGDTKLLSSYLTTVTSSVGFADDPEVVKACNPTSEMEFDMDSFLEGGTLYLINSEENRSIAPLMTALTEHIHGQARRRASKMPHKRLTPGVELILDEVAQTTPVPLPKWAAESRGHGITIKAAVQDTAQLVSRYGPEGARTILNSLSMKVGLSGGMMSDQEDLELLCRAAGKRDVDRKTHGTSDGPSGASQSTSTTPIEEDTLTPDRMQALPLGYALLKGPGEKACVVKFPNGTARAKKMVAAMDKAEAAAHKAEARAAERARVQAARKAEAAAESAAEEA